MNHYQLSDISVGMQESFHVQVTEEMFEDFSRLSMDRNPLHMEDSYARKNGFQSRIGFGLLTASFLSTLAGMYLPGELSLIHQVEVEFPTPVFAGDILTVIGKVSQVDISFRYIILKVTIRNQNGKKVLRGKMRVGIRENSKE